MPDNAGFEERIKNSFKNVKEDIESIKSGLNSQKEEIIGLKSEIKNISSIILEIKDNLDFFKKISIGNKGVINDQQQSSTINNNAKQQSSTEQHLKSTLSKLSQTLTSAFQSLTDREFSVFTAIFELESSLPEVTYSDLAQKLGISEPTVRNMVNQLITKKMPLQKIRFFNRKVSLSIAKDLHDLNLLSKLIELRQNPHNQKTLFDV